MRAKEVKEYFEFYGYPKIISGNKALEHIPVELDGYDARKPLVITSRKITGAGADKTLIEALCDSNVILGAVCDEVPEYSSITLVREIARLFRDRGCDSIIALGGGAVVDVAKGVNIMTAADSADIMKFAGKDRVPSNLKPLFVLPAQSMTGYETVNTALLDRHEFTSDYLYPDVVVIDPRIAAPCCPECVVNGAMIALTHSIESASSDVSSPMNDSFAHAAISFVAGHLKKAVRRPRNKTAGLAMANASALSGIAFSNSPDGMVHLLGEALSVETGIRSGICMGIMLPVALELKLKSKQGIRGELLLSLAGIDEYSATPEKERPAKALGIIRRLRDESSKAMPGSLKALNIPAYKLEHAARSVAGAYAQYPIGDCMEVLRGAWEGEPSETIKS